MYKITNQVCYSTDGELFDLDFPDELEVGDKYYQADAVDITAADIVNTHSLNYFLEECDDILYEMIGEAHSGKVFNLTKEQLQELKSIICKYLDEKHPVNYFRVENSVEKTVVEGDV